MKRVCSLGLDLAYLITSEKGPYVLRQSNQKFITTGWDLNGTI